MTAESLQLPATHQIVHRSEGKSTGFLRVLGFDQKVQKMLLCPAFEKDLLSSITILTRDQILQELREDTAHIIPEGLRDCLHKFAKKHHQKSARFEHYTKTGPQTCTVVARFAKADLQVALVEKLPSFWQVQQAEQLDLVEPPDPLPEDAVLPMPPKTQTRRVYGPEIELELDHETGILRKVEPDKPKLWRAEDEE